jgi:drug/metabolite transporter (DMT)-like permease
MKYIVVLVYVFSFGIADCLWVNVNRKNHELVSMLGRSLVTTALFVGLVLWLFWTSPALVGTHPDFADIASAIGLSAVCYGGQYFYVHSLRHMPVSVSITLVSIFTFLITILISVVVYKEALGLVAIAMMLLTLLGVVLLVDRFTWKAIPTYRTGMLYILLASPCWGLSYSFIKFPIKTLGVVNFSLLLEGTILFLNVLLFYRNGLKLRSLGDAFYNSWKYIIALGILIFLGTVFNALSYNYFGVVTLNIVGKVGVVVPIVYALLFLNEVITKKQAFGILLVLSGAAAVSLVEGINF